MKYAVVEIGGKQYKVSDGMTLEVDKIGDSNIGNVVFEKVLLYVNEGDVQLGKPYVLGAAVKARLIENTLGKKIRVARFTSKSRHRRVVGFRPSYSKIQISEINVGSVHKKAAKK